MTLTQSQSARRQNAKIIVRVWYLVTIMILLTTCNQSSSPPPSQSTPSSQNQLQTVIQCSARSSTPINLAMYYSSEKQQWIEEVVKDFNSRGISACDGPIHVNATPLGSGVAMQKILNGDRPDIWSPASRVWLNLLNAKWRNLSSSHKSDLVTTTSIDSPSLVISPIVIAMWKSRANALPKSLNQLGWSDIATLSTASQGWTAYGHSEWGMFKFAHTNPNESNSGLDAVISEYYAALKKESGLSISDVGDGQAQNFVAGIERSIIYYGDSTGFFADEMCKKGPNYLDAAVLYESLVVEMNEGKLSSVCPEPVVAIYPKEGTFYSDHPFAIPQWVTDNAKRTSALAFRNFLFKPAQQTKALLFGFRPADLSIRVTTPIDSSRGVDPAQPKTTLQMPSADVVQAIQATWGQLRHRVAVMLLLDISGSMNYLVEGIPKIRAAKQGLKQFIGLLSDSDWVGLTTFSTEMHVLSLVSPLGPKRQAILNQIDGISAGGDTRLYDTIADQMYALNALSSHYIKAVVVLTDGVDTVSQLSLAQLLKEITPANLSTENEVRVFTIAYGDQSYIDVNGLTRIAETTGGAKYTGTLQNIQQVYAQISHLFAG